MRHGGTFVGVGPTKGTQGTPLPLNPNFYTDPRQAKLQGMYDHLFKLEQELLETSTRQNRARLEQLLALEFFEFGSSGTAWSRGEILDRLPAEIPTPIRASNFKAFELSQGVVLVTYKTDRTESDKSLLSALRSSIWKLNQAGWQMFFHQGTKI